MPVMMPAGEDIAALLSSFIVNAHYCLQSPATSQHRNSETYIVCTQRLAQLENAVRDNVAVIDFMTKYNAAIAGNVIEVTGGVTGGVTYDMETMHGFKTYVFGFMNEISALLCVMSPLLQLSRHLSTRLP